MRHLITSILLLSAIGVSAQEDITSQYISNPSFELDDISKLAEDATRGAYTATSLVGWNLTGSYGVSDIMTSSATATDNNFGKPGNPSAGKQMYYIRNAWNASSASLLQSINLPVGKYRLSVDNKCITASSHSANIVAGSASSSLTFNSSMPSSWATTYVDFEMKTAGSISIGVKVNFGSGSGGSIMLDNFRLYNMNNYVEPQDPTETSITSPTEGKITPDFVNEATMKSDLLQMLANFSRYMVNDFQECQAPNSVNEACGAFKGENTMGNDERGVRPNADLSMICAFLVKYGKQAGVTLPNGITWAKIEDMAMKSLVFAYSTHKANKLKVCSNNNYWGSTSTSDAVWESSLWAMSVAYSAYFQWDKLTNTQKDYIYKLLKAECNYELYRNIPTGYNGDTKAEENGWEVDILAATLGLFPNDPLAPKWFERMREFAINSYSHPSDASNTTVIDPDYDNTTVADLYKGQNLYDDYSLQNHNLFHTSYQNVVMQELGEAALALKMFQLGIHGTEKWKSNALMHNNQEVQDNILNWLALPDGELAMPNGNDWSLFLYDQITSYTTQACFQRDANALMLENMAYKYIKARQQTTTDGSWLLRADVGARRMGVEAHRVMMTYLMHDVLSTADLTAPTWEEFNQQHSEAKMIPCQNIVRASNPYMFSCFSWSNGLKSYTGYFAQNSADKNKIIVPYRANNTGNIIGWYDVSGKSADATPVVSGIYQLEGNSYVMNGELNTNGSSLNNRFAIYSTPSRALIYLDYVTANSACTITAEKGGLLAISTDELTKLSRTLYYNKSGEIAHKQTDGSSLATFVSDWVNIDNQIGVVGLNSKMIAFGDRGANNSIFTSKLYPMYSNTTRSVKAADVVDARNLIYYSLADAEETSKLATEVQPLRSQLPAGWNGVIASDTNCGYLLISNFKGANTASLKGIQYKGWAPVLREQTSIANSQSSADISLVQNNSFAQPLKVIVKGTALSAKLDTDTSALITATASGTYSVGIATEQNSGFAYANNLSIKKGETVRVYLNEKNEVCVQSASIPSLQKGEDLTQKIVNPSFDGNISTGWSGTAPAFQSYTDAEFFNKTFDIYQTITGLKPGLYEVGVQAFYREGSYANAATKHSNGTESLNATLYANDSSTPLASIFSDANNNYKVGVSTSAGYIPDNMEQAASYFRGGLYRNSLIALVGEDGVLKIGLKKTKSVANDWTIFDNFTLKYYGIVGDVNGDGNINVTDAVDLIDKLTTHSEAALDPIISNADKNAAIDRDDAVEIINIYLGSSAK